MQIEKFRAEFWPRTLVKWQNFSIRASQKRPETLQAAAKLGPGEFRVVFLTGGLETVAISLWLLAKSRPETFQAASPSQEQILSEYEITVALIKAEPLMCQGCMMTR